MKGRLKTHLKFEGLFYFNNLIQLSHQENNKH